MRDPRRSGGQLPSWRGRPRRIGGSCRVSQFAAPTPWRSPLRKCGASICHLSRPQCPASRTRVAWTRHDMAPFPPPSAPGRLCAPSRAARGPPRRARAPDADRYLPRDRRRFAAGARRGRSGPLQLKSWAALCSRLSNSGRLARRRDLAAVPEGNDPKGRDGGIPSSSAASSSAHAWRSQSRGDLTRGGPGRIRGVHAVRPGSRGPGYAWRGFRMSKQPGNLNAVFGRFRRRMLAAELSTGAIERRDIGNASEPARRTMPATPPDSPPRLPVRALGEYVPGGRVDAMRRLLRGR